MGNTGIREKKRLKQLIFIVFAALFFIGGGHQNVQAIEYEMMGGKPAYPDPVVENSSSWFIYGLNSGESKEDAVRVMNLYKRPYSALVYAADTTRSSSGGFALRQFAEPREEVGSWVRFYPNDPPEMFLKIFEELDRKIIPFCNMDRKSLKKKFNKKGQQSKKKIADSDFSEFEEWCRGVEHIERKLESKEEVIIPFVFRVPENVDAGEHTGGILIQRINPEGGDEVAGSVVRLTTRVGVRIYETVPGEIIKKLALENFNIIKNFKEFDVSRSLFSYWLGKGNPKPEEFIVQSKIRNEGNVSVKHKDIIHIKDLLFGKRNEDVSREFQALKKDSFISNYTWNNPRFGRFSFIKEIKYEDASGAEQAIITSEIKIWIIPWREIVTAIVLLLVVAGIHFGYRHYQKKKYGGIDWVEYKVKKGDNINKLAKKYNIGWKVLAKTNKIEAPYLLEVGQAILAPPTGKVKGKNGLKQGGNKKKSAKKEGKKTVLLAFIKSKKNIILAVLAVVAVAAATIVTILVVNNKKKTVEIKEKISISSLGGSGLSGQELSQNDVSGGDENAEGNEQEKEKVQPEQAIIPALELNILILNGGGVSGSAGKMRDLLKESGYEKAEADNAKEYNHQGIVIYYQNGFEKMSETIKEFLGRSYSGMKIEKGSSEEEISANVVVIIGE